MGKLTALPAKRVIKALDRAGWEICGGAKHCKLVHPTKPGALTVPRKRMLKTGTVRAIIRQAGLTVKEFFELYK